MRKIVLLFLYLLSISCSISKVELQVVNNFVEQKIKEKYSFYKDKENILINKAGNGKGALLVYEQKYKDTSQFDYKFQNWIVNDIELEKLKKQIKTRKKYYWKESDFSNFKFYIIGDNENRQNFKSNYYLSIQKEFIIITISKPVLIDKRHALVWFGVKNKFGSTLDNCVVLMEKGEGIWKIKSYYHYEIY